jgi:hypothetical protein
MRKVCVRKLGAINARIGSLQRTYIHSAQMFGQGSVKARQRLVISGRHTISQPNPREGTRVSDLSTADHSPSSPINEFGVTPGYRNLERSTPGAPK